jgi:LPXTG-motif cell wall-anchored protein
MVSHRRDVGLKMWFMAKKTGMSDSSLWIAMIVLLAIAAWMYFKR